MKIKTAQRLILLIVLVILSGKYAFAKHIIGGEVTYECLGPNGNSNQYRITMRIYRDCDPANQGADFDPIAYFSIYRGTANANTFLSSQGVNSTSISSIIPDTPACIQNVPEVCVEQGIYIFTIDLPVIQNGSYFIVYQRCCRNNSIVNIQNPEDVGATYSVEITAKAQQLCNNSPVFKEFPPIIICKSTPLVFDHSATDINGDQLVYRFCAPEEGGGPILSDPAYTSCAGAQPIPPCAPPFDPVPFIQPAYTPTNPMGGNPQITINPVTGVISGVPNIEGRFVVGVCVDEYRNGEKLSVVKRDFQFNVADCDPKVLTVIDGGDTLVFSPPNQYYISACGAKDLYIENKSLDISFISEFEWRFDLNGTPYVNNSDWSPTVPFPEPNRYIGQLLLNPGAECSDTADIIIDIFPGITADFSYVYDTCVAGPVDFTDLSTAEANIESWTWQFGVPNGTSTAKDPSWLYNIPGNHPVRLRVSDQNGCTDTAIKPVNYFPAPQYVIIQPDSYVGCVPGVITFLNLSVPIDSTYHIVWNFGDGTILNDVISPTHAYTTPGLYDVSVEITSPIGCYIADTFPDLIKVVPSPEANFSYSPDDPSNIEPLVTFTDLSKDANRWFWQFDKFGTSNTPNPAFTFPDTGLMRILLVVTHPQGCKDSMLQVIDVRPEIRWFMPNAFSPNGDGINDGFYGKGFLEGATDFTLTIWNRWGELVFETNNPNDQWNGRAQNTGGNSPSGVYVYRVTYSAPRGERVDIKGFATLIR